MGIIKALTGAVGGSLADQWLEVIEPNEMSDTTVFTKGTFVRKDGKRGSNKKGTEDFITDGSVIHVYDNQFMLLVDGGRIIDYSSEPGYYKVSNSSAPSMFNGDLGDAVKETFERFKFGGVPSTKQQVFFINLQEIKGIKFGTRNAINYFDNFYNAELFLRTHGSYSIKITDPIKFYQEAIPRNAERVDINDINEQYLNEFLEALQSAINQMSAEGVRISHVASKSSEVSKYMNQTLDEEWSTKRGMEISSVGIASISYDPESQELINMRNKGAMLSDPSVREGYVQGSMARGIEAAGSNPSGSAGAFFGMNMGMGTGGSMASSFSETNKDQMATNQNANNKNATTQSQGQTWTCGNCNTVNKIDAQFCSNCGKEKAISGTWACGKCSNVNIAEAKFCSKCGEKKAVSDCPKCGSKIEDQGAKFCPKCGTNLN